MMRLKAFVMLALSLPALCAAAPAIGVFTIVEGDAIVIRDSQRFPVAEGLQLQADDIVHTGDKTQFVRMELAQGGAVDLGPATRLLLKPRFTPAGDRPTQIYLAQGWLKLTAAAAHKVNVASARMDITEIAGVGVARVTEELTFLFVESGNAKLVERGPQGRPYQLAGEAYERRGNEPGTVLSRPSADVLKAMPRAFADTLPLRAKRFQDAAVAPSGAAEISYEDVAMWINAERSLRPAFVQRWTGKARDPTFRSSLIAELRQHPEWDRVLFPEKYLPKPKPPVTAAASAPAPSTPAVPPVSSVPEPRPVDPDRDPLRPWEVRRP